MTPIRTLAGAALALALSACSALETRAPESRVSDAELAEPALASATTEGVHRFRVGRLEAMVLRDGGLSAPNDGKTVWSDPGRDEVARVLAAAGLPTDTVSLSLQVLLVRLGGRVLLVDSGFGAANPSAGQLFANLPKAGLSPGQVTDVVITHGHGDHVLGLVTAAGGAAFPNARVHMTVPEWQAVRADADNAKLVAAIGSRVVPFQPGATLLPGVTAVEVRGHTPGHTAVQIESDGQRLLAIGDTAHHYVVSLRQPEFTINFDRDAPTAEASRRALLQRAADQRLKVFAPHFPYPGLGYVRREDDGFAWTPAP